MSLDYSTALANAALDAIYDTNFPATSTLDIRSGAPAGADNAASGTLLAQIALPATPWAAAASSTKAKNGTWQDASANATGTAGHFRMTGTTSTMKEEGTITATGGGGDMTLDNTSIAIGQPVTVNTYSRSA